MIDFVDFDEFRNFNSDLDGRWMIYGKLDFHWKAETFALGDSKIISAYSQTGLITEGIAFTDFYQFYVPIANGWRNNGVSFGLEDVLILEPGAQHYTVTKTPNGYLGVFIPADMIILPETFRKQALNSYTVKVSFTISEQLRRLFQQYITAVQNHAEIEFSSAAKLVEDEFKSILVPLLEKPQAPKRILGRNQISRQQIIEEIKVVIEESAAHPINVAKLVAKTGVSERTLLSIFQEYYEIGPYQYLQLRLLHQVREDLISAHPEQTTVTKALMCRGVLEFGRFALRYKRHFGESPKQTLQRKGDNDRFRSFNLPSPRQ